MAEPNEPPLRREIVELGEILGQVIASVAGDESLRLVENIRRRSRDSRQRDRGGGESGPLRALLASLDYDQLRIVIRAFTIFLDLANMAEDRQRVRVLQRRAAECHPDPTEESIHAAFLQLKSLGRTADEIQELVRRLRLELVFTAHPTEAKRGSIRSKLRAVRDLLEQRDSTAITPARRLQIKDSLRAELTKLWLTDFIRPWRPTVLQEVRRGLSFKPNLWRIVPRIMDGLRAGLAEVFPERLFEVSACLGFGSWIGGDRDGHPFVTPEVTEQTILWQREAAIDLHLQTCQSLRDSLSISKRQIANLELLSGQIANAQSQWPELEPILAEIPPDELVRQWLGVIHWRLSRTKIQSIQAEPAPGAYATADEFQGHVRYLHATLLALRGAELLASATSEWLDRIEIFGFHLARLDVRQDSRVYKAVIDELLENAGLANGGMLSEDERQRALTSTLTEKVSLDSEDLSEAAQETLALFRLLRLATQRFGHAALGSHVISMTNQPSDVLSVMWLWNHAETANEVGLQELDPIAIVPLFETIEDLQNAPGIMAALFESPPYRQLLERQGDHQTVMLGYSDSTKDGGYLAACWSLFECQQRLQQLANQADIDIVFFHGRGGSLGRGGGPAARSILSLPRRAFHGELRLTEQGEVLADRYDDPNIAHRHLEQLLWSSLLASGTSADDTPEEWFELTRRLAGKALAAYRQLVEQPGFVEFFRTATPISEVEQLPIGSRPSRRRGGNALSDLRAIPWVFSWTQSRLLLPAWFGIGAAFAEELQDAAGRERLKTMYRKWPFFAATIDNAELALAKADLGIAGHYAELLQSDEAAVIVNLVEGEYAHAKQAVLDIVGSQELLDTTSWLQEAIRVRNWYIDPLNFIQVELLRRLQSQPDTSESAAAAGLENEELRHLMRLTVNGIAAGMRTTG